MWLVYPIFLFFFHVLLFSILTLHCSANDCLQEGSAITDGTSNNTLVSPGGVFELGFFTPDGDNKNCRYLGIWYHDQSDPRIIVWVANRNKPLLGSTGSLILENGKAKVLDTNNKTYWSTDVAASRNTSYAPLCLHDTGNLILYNRGERGIQMWWQSFNHPTDTILPGMDIVHENLNLTSWRTHNDPAQGYYMFKWPVHGNKLVVFEGSLHHWESEVTPFDQTPKALFDLLLFNSNQSKGVENTRLVMNFAGQIQLWRRESRKGWSLSWSEPKDKCSVYKVCGNFGSCNSNDGLLCECLQGFTPSSPKKWKLGIFSEGCKPKSSTWTCSRNYATDEFLRKSNMKVSTPESNETTVEKNCATLCLDDCTCVAYSCGAANCTGTSNEMCLMWYNKLTGLQEGFSNGLTIFIRSTQSDLVNQTLSALDMSTVKIVHFSFKVVLSLLCIAVALATVLLCGVFLINRMRRKSIAEKQGLLLFREEVSADGVDVPFFRWGSIQASTNKFADANKLGTGGFGSVYRGKLPEGQEIAVKRLSSVSMQGLEEFRTEVKLIAKLQHRNLVRLIGYCMKADEKILVYEYMPNGSLDSCLFDEKHTLYLDWNKRFDIILGIARGLLYLHQDSRLRIIHRDLKPSNILLDEELNPKISDFGIARIVGGKETQANTSRVVGTYGYMSPEYAYEGSFSVKSDVFSIGVVILEIIIGRRNSKRFVFEHGLSLLGHAWKLWNEDKGLELMDPKLHETCFPSEVLKCIHIGLLCVQEDPSDRPTMSTVVHMLSGENASLPLVKQPAFIDRKPLSENASSSSAMDSSVHEMMTVSTVGR